jgi:DNA excision repair protein ERCC-4
VNATPSDEAGIGDELGIMGVRDPGFRIITYGMTVDKRYVSTNSREVD